MCQLCCKIQSWTSVVDLNHVHESLEELYGLCAKYKAIDPVDPDNLRDMFLKCLMAGNLSIPEVKELIKAKYDLYPPIDPPNEDGDKP